MEAFKHFVTDEWYFAVPMFLMSLTALVLVAWRWLLNINLKTDMDDFMPAFQERLQRGGVDAVLKMCKVEPGVIPNKLFVAGLEAAPQGLAAMKRNMATTMELEIMPKMNFLLAPILAIAKISTMVGLLGTVISMINTFSAISNSSGDPSAVGSQAGAIGLALFATALGLITAIPLVFFHVLFKDFIARFEARMKLSAQKFLVVMQNFNATKGSSRSSGEPELARR
ncbi:MotA/TolQ/ExbB proton channel family protein [Tuwongella immobilis]|uniref:MotA/TolQ/ExbB proton channel domain-containing protein n=1 Tax=Tuwongella immobilis TaxID=692036 RepID=A0A6C2YS48_9BACT|nr:MotA/TolQ/ExbB proton channel family protein [Tuwongella immobilis]VIP04174.1 biopolymer transporter : Gll1141 protein OS=Gloeobacter violaceus (strain PCC 7421) GN=gll1141 PE=3 SV=1: MotA_ExbB [Tuwongella immobilis]VTS05712.1 biopolymer transporter : Gll1141 protein OS=Gloeobacter violaceus (strain PCC 7421) GN=gll1141 PE=3 SV=1: MotA_ExbB [Tuwongella immobilis]